MPLVAVVSVKLVVPALADDVDLDGSECWLRGEVDRFCPFLVSTEIFELIVCPLPRPRFHLVFRAGGRGGTRR